MFRPVLDVQVQLGDLSWTPQALVDTGAQHLLEQLAVATDRLSTHVGRPLSLIAESDLFGKRRRPEIELPEMLDQLNFLFRRDQLQPIDKAFRQRGNRFQQAELGRAHRPIVSGGSFR